MTSTAQVCRATITASLLEGIRRKDLYVMLTLTVLMAVGAYSFNFFGVSGLEIFVKDMTFSCVGLFATIIGVITAARQIPDEVERRTIYPLLARPVTRWQLMVGKFAAAWVTLTLSFLVLTGAGCILLLCMRIGLPPIFFQYVYLKCISFFWLCGFVMFLSVHFSQGTTITLGMLIALGSGLFTRAFSFVSSAPAALKPVITLLYGLLPNYTLFDLTKKVVYVWPPISFADIAFLTIYGILIGLFWLWLGWIRFRRQPV